MEWGAGRSARPASRRGRRGACLSPVQHSPESPRPELLPRSRSRPRAREDAGGHPPGVGSGAAGQLCERPVLAWPAPPPPRAMAQPLSRPLILSPSQPWPPATPSPHFPNLPRPRPMSQRMPRSRSPLQPQSLPLAWPLSPPRPLFHPLSQFPAQHLTLSHPQRWLKPLAQPQPVLPSPSHPLFPPHLLPLFEPQCSVQRSPVSQPLPPSLCLPKSLPLAPRLSHTLPLSQPRLRSGLQLPPALLLLLLFSVLGPGAGECRNRKD